MASYADQDRRANVGRRARQWLDRAPVFLDTETTGLDNRAEICEIAVVAADGTSLVDTLVRPTQSIPDGACRVHGITDDDVRGSPTFAEVAPWLREVLDGREVVIYNADYDVRLLRQSAQARRLPSQAWDQSPTFRCAMQLYAEYHGAWNRSKRAYAWHKQHVAAGALGLALPEDLHRARADAELCRRIIRKMAGY